LARRGKELNRQDACSTDEKEMEDGKRKMKDENSSLSPLHLKRRQ